MVSKPVMSIGKLFQRYGVAKEKALVPSVGNILQFGTNRRSFRSDFSSYLVEILKQINLQI